MTELKACDYCKGMPYIAHWETRWLKREMRWQIRCDWCGKRGPITKDKQAAISTWNKGN